MVRDINTILVPIDFSTNTTATLDYATMIARRFSATMHLIHVCEVPPMMTMDAYAVASLDWNERLGDAAERELGAVAAGLNNVSVSTEVLMGNPARCIVTAATTSQADLIVMGTHGHGAVMHLLMGNVAERVLRTAPCPVLTVREPAVDVTVPIRTRFEESVPVEG
jgi:nucleotide-binding universal stress UspA family protein